ncbi:MAG: response regulator, partial [Rhodothermales bacterium]|nr:response regulator [Rhodothermales bacterium]
MAKPLTVRNVRVLIVDDERPARDKVRRFVEADPDVAVVFEAGNGYDALEVIRAESPDILFLDVQMPGMDGIGLLEALPRESIPHLVFVTAFDEYALKAFELHAIDYLLKPFDAQRFREAMSRAKSAVAAERGAIEIERLHQALAALRDREQPVDRLMVREGHRRVLLRLEEVVRIRAARNGVVVHTAAKQFRMSETIGAL